MSGSQKALRAVPRAGVLSTGPRASSLRRLRRPGSWCRPGVGYGASPQTWERPGNGGCQLRGGLGPQRRPQAPARAPLGSTGSLLPVPASVTCISSLGDPCLCKGTPLPSGRGGGHCPWLTGTRWECHLAAAEALRPQSPQSCSDRQPHAASGPPARGRHHEALVGSRSPGV